jgi:glycosyltransferase involved in cell wall biosynthesis
MTVTVAIPWHGRPDLLVHCVETVLAQTFRDIHVVVVGDGEEPPLAHIRDTRLDVWHIPENRGAYYVRQLILLASAHAWHAPIDADDCIDRGHLALMLAQRQRKALVAPNKLCGHVSGRCEHRGGVDGRVYGAGRYHVGLFRRDLLLSVGGYDPAERLVQDTLLLRILRLVYPRYIRTVDDPGYLEAPTYHRIRHAASLTRDPASNHASDARKAMKKRNRDVVVACAKLRTPERVKAYREGRVPPALADELARHVETLSARLGVEAVA